MQLKRAGFLALALGLILSMQAPAMALASPTGGQPSVTASAPAYTRVLKRGCKGSDVKTLQGRLQELGYYNSALDGLFGAGTQNAVKAFQKVNSLKVDGVVGRVTHNALYSAGTSGGGTGGDGGTSTPSPTYNLGKLDNQVTLKKGSKGANVKDLQTVLTMKGFYSSKIDGSFGSGTLTAVKNFQRSVKLEADGVAGNYTLSALYTMLNPPDLNTITPWPNTIDTSLSFPVEKLTWDTVCSSVFARNLTAVVIDVRSGYSFNIKRTGGTKHADVETITPTDTATFYKAVGNFSWARHPVWVIVNGRRLAASMNCMPHGYDSLPGNDFKGQFCIHFVGSRTHGSNKVDPDHQACIEEAYEAGLTITSNPNATPAPTAEPTATPEETPVG